MQQRINVESFVQSVDKEVYRILDAEEQRPFEDYSFYKLESDSPFNVNVLVVSPLAQFPPKSQVPGIIGYFQITPDDRLESPVLPSKTAQGFLPKEVEVSGISELNQRLSYFEDLKAIITGESRPQDDNVAMRLSASKNKQEVLAEASDSLESMEADIVEESELKASTISQFQDSDSIGFTQGLADDYPERSERRSEPSKQMLSKKSSPAPRGRRKVQVNVPVQLKNPKVSSPIGVLSFEGEIDPLQFSVLSGGNFIFFRRVWREKKRFIQGFIVNSNVFLDRVIGEPFNDSSFDSQIQALVQVNGSDLKTYRKLPNKRSYLNRAPPPTGVDDVLLATNLAAPVDALQITFRFSEITASSSILIDILVIVIALVLLCGFYAMYRLGSSQIALAQARSDFVSAVSHELKTPLTSIRMYSEMLRSDWVKDQTKRQAYYDYIFHESERLSRLIANILRLSKLSREETYFDLKEHSADALLQSLQSKLRSQVEHSGFELRLIEPENPSDRELYLRADEDALTQIAINLVDNAIKFSGDVKEIEFGYRVKRGAEVIFFVRDFGPGIPPAKLKKIFELFYRIENEITRNTPGTGIGLALVAQLAAAMEARAQVVNKNPGAEFQIAFRIC